MNKTEFTVNSIKVLGRDLEREESISYWARYYMCECICGKVFSVYGRYMLKIISCGCVSKTKHGASRHPLYAVWRGAKDRCHNLNSWHYKNYGAKGVFLDPVWFDVETGFPDFYAWSLANGWAPGLELDRIDVNGPYSPENCRYVSRKDNCRNKRKTVKVLYKGEERILAELIESSPLDGHLIRSRIKKGWDIERALTELPTNQRKELPTSKRLLRTLNKIKTRCYVASDEAYHNYGGRGIIVCEEWRQPFEGVKRFISWALENGYTKDLQVDRIDVNGPYSPENCRLVTSKVNNRNKRETLMGLYEGEIRPLMDIYEETHPPVTYYAFCKRIRKGWSIEEAITTPLNARSPK